MKIDTQLTADLADVPAQARALQEMGFDGAFTFEGPHDPFFPLVAAAPACGLDLMTNVAIAFPRNPIHLAHQAYDLQALSQGRFRLGLGTQVRTHIERRFGIEWSRPVARMRELVLALKAIFACWHEGERLDFDGDFYTHRLMTFAFNPGPLDSGPPPILLGALGPRMIRMTAEVADGLLVMPFNSARSFRELTLPAVADGLAAAGRTADEFEIACEVIVAAGRTDEEQTVADAGVRGLLGFYGSTPAYRRILEIEGRGDLQPELNALSKQGRWFEMSRLVDDSLLETLAVRGTPVAVAAGIVERFGPAVDRVGFYLPYAAHPDLVAEIIAALREVT